MKLGDLSTGETPGFHDSLCRILAQCEGFSVVMSASCRQAALETLTCEIALLAVVMFAKRRRHPFI
jgi:hypothetical protein